LGIGDWAQSPIPNPQSPISLKIKFKLIIIKYITEIIINIIKIMKMSNDFKYSYSNILGLLLEFKNKGLISNEQKKKIKGTFTYLKLQELILENNSEVNLIITDFQLTQNKHKLIETLRILSDNMMKDREKPLMDLDPNNLVFYF